MLLRPSYISLGILISHLGSSWGSRPGNVMCEEGHFYNRSEDRCKRCSPCPPNKIIKRPCSEFKDVKCGPFNFKDFSELDIETNSVIIGNDRETHNEDRSQSRGRSPGDEMDGPTTVEKEDREYWKTLAFALIGLLSVLIIVATVVVLLACRKLQRVSETKQPEDGDMDDADSGYVVIRAIRNVTESRPGHPDLSYYTREEMDAHPPLLASTYSDTDPHSVLDPSSHPHTGRLCFLPRIYTPQRRLLNYDSDDVFEVDDSATSTKAVPKHKLCTIAEKSISSSSKNSDSISKDTPDGDVK